MNQIETYYGYLNGCEDAEWILNMCQLGYLGIIQRRLTKIEKKYIRSGSIFVFIENKNIKRWTDGKQWSPGKCIGWFQIYKEIEKIGGKEEKKKIQKRLKPRGLTKKAISAEIDGKIYTVVSYYSKEEVEKFKKPFKNERFKLIDENIKFDNEGYNFDRNIENYYNNDYWKDLLNNKPIYENDINN